MLVLSPPQWWLALLCAGVGLLLSGAALRRAPRQQRWRYDPQAAWLRAGAYFAGAWSLAWASGAAGTIIDNAVVFADQTANFWWWLLLGACVVVVFVGYWVIWPRDTRPHGRRVVVPDTVLFAVVWGISEGLLFASVWVLNTRLWRGAFGEGIAAGIGTYVTTVVVLSVFVGAWHAFYWDIHIAPEHNIIDANLTKVAFVHTPNVLLTTLFVSVFENLALYVLLQAFALFGSALAMPFPGAREPLPVDPDGPRLGPRVDAPVPLVGQTIVVVGGASWLGRRTSLRFAERGARVVLVDDSPEIDAVVGDITGRTGAFVSAVPIGVVDRQSAARAVAAIQHSVQSIDVVLVATSRITTGTRRSGALDDAVVVNHLGASAFVDAVRPLLAESARVVHVVTDSQFQARPRADQDLGALAGRELSPGQVRSTGVSAGVAAYGLSGLLVAACAMDRAERWASAGISVLLVNPGGLVADVAGPQSTAERRLATWLGRWRRPRLAVDACDYACTSPELDRVSGWYLKDRRPIRPSLLAQDPAFQVRARRWTEAELAVGDPLAPAA